MFARILSIHCPRQQNRREYHPCDFGVMPDPRIRIRENLPDPRIQIRWKPQSPPTIPVGLNLVDDTALLLNYPARNPPWFSWGPIVLDVDRLGYLK